MPPPSGRSSVDSAPDKSEDFTHAASIYDHSDFQMTLGL